MTDQEIYAENVRLDTFRTPLGAQSIMQDRIQLETAIASCLLISGGKNANQIDIDADDFIYEPGKSRLSNRISTRRNRPSRVLLLMQNQSAWI